MADEARRWLVAGQVQGVGFRWWLREQANGLALRGWVRNLADGRVEAVASGPGDALDAFDRAARTGPPSARVGQVHAGAWAGPVDGAVDREGGFATIADAAAPAEP